MLVGGRIERVRRKVAGAGAAAELRGDGAGRAVELKRPVPAAWLGKLEERWRVELPAAYREFLRLIGECGSGPYHGLLPTRRWDDHDHVVPSKPFPVGPGHRYADDEWWREFGWRDEEDDVWPGMITLAHLGCGYLAGLVVTGEARGRVVYTFADERPPFFPPHADFLAWYENWLDEVMCDVQVGWFGRWEVQDPEVMIDALTHPKLPPRRRGLLALQLTQLGTGDEPPDEALPALFEAAADDDPVVRAAAYCALGHRADQQDAVAKGAEDPDPWVAAIAEFGDRSRGVGCTKL